jgi:hypothetical protein
MHFRNLFKSLFVKKLLLCLLSLLVIHSFQPVVAQITTGYFRLIKMSWQSDKKFMVDKLMEFSETEADAFWPLYEKHMQKWGRLMEYRIVITQEYCDEFEIMKGTQMSMYMKEMVKNDIDLTRLQKKFFSKIRRILSPTRANQFMKIEYEFQLVLLTQMQQRTPFIGDNLKKL